MANKTLKKYKFSRGLKKRMSLDRVKHPTKAKGQGQTYNVLNFTSIEFGPCCADHM